MILILRHIHALQSHSSLYTYIDIDCYTDTDIGNWSITSYPTISIKDSRSIHWSAVISKPYSSTDLTNLTLRMPYQCHSSYTYLDVSLPWSLPSLLAKYIPANWPNLSVVVYVFSHIITPKSKSWWYDVMFCWLCMQSIVWVFVHLQRILVQWLPSFCKILRRHKRLVTITSPHLTLYHIFSTFFHSYRSITPHPAYHFTPNPHIPPLSLPIINRFAVIWSNKTH